MGPDVMETSLKNVNVVSEDEVKTVCRKIDLKKNYKQRNQRFKGLIFFIK